MKKYKTYAGRPTKARKQRTESLTVWFLFMLSMLTWFGIFQAKIMLVVPEIKAEEKRNTFPIAKDREIGWQEQVLIEIRKAGLDDVMAECVIQKESNWETGNYHVNRDGTVDRGLWMINSYWHREVSNECAFDALCSTKEAIRIYKSRGNWNAWYGYYKCLK